MGKQPLTIAALVALLAFSASGAEIKRSKKVLRQFVQVHACPSTGKHRLPCQGYHIDHIKPLCAGGPDSIDNLQWLSREAHKQKTKIDIGDCAYLRRK